MMTKKRTGRFVSLKMMITISIVIASLFIFSGSAYSQAQEEIFFVADEMPAFPGGQKALMDFIYKNISYPADASENGIEGKVLIRFAVNQEGKIVQPSITKGVSPSIDKEVLRVVAKIPKFEPGKIAGKPVSVWYAVPVTFKIR